jgi:hypothetical protein
MKTLKPGLRLKSATCETEIMVIKAPPGTEVDICCGGLPMREMNEDVTPSPEQSDFMQGTLMGKRYIDTADTIEVLCTKGGEGSVSIDGASLAPREARALPSSD